MGALQRELNDDHVAVHVEPVTSGDAELLFEVFSVRPQEVPVDLVADAL